MFCWGLSHVTIPEGVTSIGYSAFYNSGLTSVSLANGVTYIGLYAFANCGGLATITIPSSVTGIDTDAFQSCGSLAKVYFEGNAPSFGVFPFNGVNPILYYLPWTTGWTTNTAGMRTTLWLPQAETSDTRFGVLTNNFGFTINWALGTVVVIEASSNLADPVWLPLQANTLTNGSVYFSDPAWTNYPSRFYRIRSL